MTKEEAIQKASIEFQFLKNNQEWNDDFDVCKKAIQRSGINIQYLSPRLACNKELALLAIEYYKDRQISGIFANSSHTLAYLNESLLDDKKVVMAAIQYSGFEYHYASDRLKSDKEIAMTVVRMDGSNLRLLPYNLKGDKEIVLTAVQKNGSLGNIFQYASDKLKGDKEFILELIKNNLNSLSSIDDHLKNDKEFALQVFRLDAGLVRYFTIPEYNSIEDILNDQGEEFLFSCFDNKSYNLRHFIAIHQNFTPTLEQMNKGLNDKNKEVREVFQLRESEWIAKIEENKLRNII